MSWVFYVRSSVGVVRRRWKREGTHPSRVISTAGTEAKHARYTWFLSLVFIHLVSKLLEVPVLVNCWGEGGDGVGRVEGNAEAHFSFAFVSSRYALLTDLNCLLSSPSLFSLLDCPV